MSATPDTDSNPAASNTGIRRRTRPDSSGTGTGTGTGGGSASASASASGGGGDAPLQDLDTGRRRSSLRRKEFPWKEFLAFFAVVGYVLGYFYRKYGVAMFVDRSHFDLKLTKEEWRELLAEQEPTICLIGGPHRAGTTILWKAVKAHPEISGFGNRFETGVDESEGILIQDVYPRYGIGMENIMKKNDVYLKKMLGVGQYALAEEEKVHLIETDRLVTEDNRAALLNRFGQHWNLTKPVWVEKSPPTAVTSRFLQALYHAEDGGTDEDGGGDYGGPPHVKFLFVTRHPAANALAHNRMVGYGSHLTLDKLMRNYLQVHQYWQTDVPHLRNKPMEVRLEDFVAEPADHLAKIYDWLGVDASPATVRLVLDERLGETIRKDVNGKYRGRWCDDKSIGGEVDEVRRNAINARYGQAIRELGLGYDLEAWCDK